MNTTTRYTLTATAAVAVVALAGLFAGRQPAPQAQQEVKATAQVAAIVVPQAAVLPTTPAALAPRAPEAVAAPVSAQLPAPASVRQVLPSVQYITADWREFIPEKLTVEPVPGCPVEFTLDRVEEVEGRTVWIGRNADIPAASYVGVGSADSYTASVMVPGASEYGIRVRGEAVTVTEKARGGACATCGEEHASTAEEVMSHAVATAPAEPEIAAAEATVHTVDVLVFFLDEVVTLIPNWTTYQKDIEDDMIAAIAQGNLVLERSGVDNMRWRFVGAVRMPTMAKKATLNEELQAFASNSFVIQQMNEKAADQGVLFASDARSDTSVGVGFGQRPGNYSVTYFPVDPLTMVHEMGHNFGLRHDRQTDSIPDTETGYNYGYRSTYAGRDYGCLMSYAANELPYFSNPSITVGSSALVAGTTDQLTIGIASGQTKASDSARWLREKAAAMAATRTPVSVPVITTQPAAQTITAGQSFSLSVTATGGNLTYQWKVGGVAIAGATAASFSKSNAQTTDAGSYSVTVTNTAGTVTSSAASVTVNAAPVTPPTPPSNGGGGGGALGAWFALALTLLLGGRGFTRRARA